MFLIIKCTLLLHSESCNRCSCTVLKFLRTTVTTCNKLGETLGFNNHLIQELLEYNEYKQILNNMEVPECHWHDWTSPVYQLRWLAYLSVTNPMLFWNSCWVKSNSRCVANVFITADSRFRARTSTWTLAERNWSVLDKCDIICIEQGRLIQTKVAHWMDVLETYFCGIFTDKIADKCNLDRPK